MEGAERAPGSPQRPRLGRSGGWRWRERPPCDGDQGVTNPEVGAAMDGGVEGGGSGVAARTGLRRERAGEREERGVLRRNRCGHAEKEEVRNKCGGAWTVDSAGGSFKQS